MTPRKTTDQLARLGGGDGSSGGGGFWAATARARGGGVTARPSRHATRRVTTMMPVSTPKVLVSLLLVAR